MGSLFRRKSHSTNLFGFLVVFGLMILILILFTVWFATLDLRGTFINTAEPADLDGDGDLDVILHNLRRESETVAFGWTTLWVNQGDGEFSVGSIELPQLPPYLYVSAIAGDVDRDEDADLLFLSPHHLMLVLNQGGTQGGRTGEFKLNNPIRPSGDIGTPGSVVLADLNDDEQLDGFVAGCCGMSWSRSSGEKVYTSPISWVWINDWNSNGWLDRHTLNLNELDGFSVRGAAIGDLDGKGSNDVFAAVQSSSWNSDIIPADLVLLNDGTGKLIDSGQRLGKTKSTSVALGDIDIDGDLDALVGSQSGARIWVNQGGAQTKTTGEFAPTRQDIPGGPTSAVFLDDLDGDGDLDALIAGNRQAVIWWNDGKGEFIRSDQSLNYSNRHGIAIEDFNGDGWPDIFAGEYSKDHRVWFNQGDGTFQREP